jgi:L-fuculose-phosphate aldolase
VVTKGVEILEEGLTQRTSGNVSVRVDEEHVAISPSSVPYREITEEDVPIIDMNGEVVTDGLTPSSEAPMHLATYRERPDVGGIVHTHSPYATTFASIGKRIGPAHYLIAFAGKSVDTAPYATNGTAELGEVAVETMGDRNAVLLRNHGVLAVGPTLDDAHNVASRVEYCARIQYQAEQIGQPEFVADAELDDLIEYFQDYS